MIFDKLENAKKYFPLHPQFEEAFKFLSKPNLAKLPLEKFELDAQSLFVMLTNKPGKTPEAAKLEAHRNYIDIQFLINGSEKIGWTPYDECKDVQNMYDSVKDIEYFSDKPQTYFTLSAGQFAIFFPEDGHAPMVGEGLIHKAVFKVKI